MEKVDYSKDDLIIALREVGVNEGDNVFIHSNIGFFGKMKDVNSADDLCANYISVIKGLVTELGTIVLPTFSYSFTRDDVFNPRVTKSKCGILSIYAYEKAGFIRSLDANFSVASWGKNDMFYVENPPHESFGKDSFWERFIFTGGKILWMNMDYGSTFTKYIERKENVSYRHNKVFDGVIELDNGEKYNDYFIHYVNSGGDDVASFVRLDDICRNSDKCKFTTLGKGIIASMDVNDYVDIVQRTLHKEPRFLTKAYELNKV